MSQPHQHPHPNGAAPTPPQDQTVLRARDASIIAQKDARLEQRSKEIRDLERREDELAALINDFYNEVLGLRSALDQVTTENRLLRARLGLPETGPLELTDEEASILPVEAVDELSDEQAPPSV